MSAYSVEYSSIKKFKKCNNHGINLPANIALGMKRGSFETRICYDRSGYCMENRHIFQKIEKLISWLIFINESVLTHFEEVSKLQTDHSLFHRRILDWVFDMIFHPKTNHWPLIGEVQYINQEQPFEQIQLDLLKYISSNGINDDAFDEALLMSSNFYDSFEHDITSVVSNINLNLTFKDNLNMLTYKSFELDLKISKGAKVFGNSLIESRKLREFKWENLYSKKLNKRSKIFAKSLNLNNHPEGIFLLEHFDKLLSNRKSQGLRIIPQIKKASENLPIEISKLCTGEEGKISGALWVVGIRRNKEDGPRICQKMILLIIHLKVFHV
jgi:hypothetical protein